jgi:hypothetical protein
VLASIQLGSHLGKISDQAVIIARRARMLIQESALEVDDELSSIFELLQEPSLSTVCTRTSSTLSSPQLRESNLGKFRRK